MSFTQIRWTVLISLVVLMVFGAESSLTAWQLDAPWLGGLSLPRMLTCHTLHWSWNHLAWDLVVFLVLGALCERRDQSRFLLTLAAGAVLIPVGIGWLQPEIVRYRGLSGIDSALFGLLATGLCRERSREGDRAGAWLMGLFLLGLMGKIGLECLRGGNLFVQDSTFVPLPWAHAIGGLVGTMAAIIDLPATSPGLIRDAACSE